MIEESKKSKIYSGVIKNLPEYKEMEELRTKIIRFIVTSSFSVLSDEEKEFIEKYPELVKKQPSIYILTIGALYNYCINNSNNEEKSEVNKEYIKRLDKILKDYPNSRNRSYIREIVDVIDFEKDVIGLGIKEIDKFDNPTKIIPILFKDLEELEINFPDIYKELLELFISWNIKRDMVVSKLQLVKDVVENKKLNLSILKANFVELYNYAKQ